MAIGPVQLIVLGFRHPEFHVVTSMLSWLAYMKRGVPRERILGVRMPPPNLKPDFGRQARSFIERIAARDASRDRVPAGSSR